MNIKNNYNVIPFITYLLEIRKTKICRWRLRAGKCWSIGFVLMSFIPEEWYLFFESKLEYKQFGLFLIWFLVGFIFVDCSLQGTVGMQLCKIKNESIGKSKILEINW